MEVRTGDETIVISVRKGHIRVKDGSAESPDRTVLQTDRETWERVVQGRARFADVGGGMGGALRCIDGKGSYVDMSWFGILTRLAQQHR